MKKTILILCSVALFNLMSLYSQVTNGGFPESYLLRDVGARPISMAGTYSAISNEPFALFYNPGGLSFLSPKATISSSYSMLEFGRTHTALAWGQSFGEVGLGFGLNHFNSGSFTGRDIRGNSIGLLRNWQFEIIAGFSYIINSSSFGASIKYLSNSLQGSKESAEGYGIDIGAKFDVFDLFSFGLSIQNASGALFWNTKSKEKAVLPYTIRSGVAMEFELNDETYIEEFTQNGQLQKVRIPPSRYLLVAVEGKLTQFEIGPTLTIGVEAVPYEIIALRAGVSVLGDDSGIYKAFPMTNWGAGISLRPLPEDTPYAIFIDYSFNNDLISTNKIGHNISVSVLF
jgi:hypothetical protein